MGTADSAAPTREGFERYLRHWNGEGVVLDDHACLHCLERGSMQYQWHEERTRHPFIEGTGSSLFDHLTLWRIGREPLVLVSQPYGVCHRDLRALLDYCEANGLEVEIDARATWHNPGSVDGVLIWHKGNRAKHYRDPASAE